MTHVEGHGPRLHGGFDRRRADGDDGTPIGILTLMPALVVLDRIPVPVLAVDGEGAIVFANRHFAELVGVDAENLKGRPFRDLLRNPGVGPVSGADLAAHAGSVVEFSHAENWCVRARMSESALLRGDDAGYLVAFQDITEQAWEHR